MHRIRRFAISALIALPLLMLIASFSRLSAPYPRLIELRARAAESGGWSPGHIVARAGQPVRFRLAADDMPHGFAVGRIDQPAVSLAPGRIVEVDVTFDRPGRYAYYCTQWCGAGHWRMRGTIEVAGRQQDDSAPPPPYVQLGLDLDAPHPSRVLPQARPSAARGAHLGVTLPPEFAAADYYRSHRPDQAWLALRAAPALQALSDQQVWDLLAFAWRSATHPLTLATGRRLYAQNCAACHGDAGAGDGVAAGAMSLPARPPGAMSSGALTPTDFSFANAGAMLGANPAVLHGKIIRGGMGTGMPYWGPIFTDQQTWALVDALWSFQFEYEEAP